MKTLDGNFKHKQDKQGAPFLRRLRGGWRVARGTDVEGQMWASPPHLQGSYVHLGPQHGWKILLNVSGWTLNSLRLLLVLAPFSPGRGCGG